MSATVLQESTEKFDSFTENTRQEVKSCITKKTLFLNLMSKAATIFYLFMETSSIHGFNHVSSKKRHGVEYLVWFIAVVTAIFAAVYISSSTWNRYLDNPTVVSMERNYQEWNTTLSAVTLCFQNKIDYENIHLLFTNELYNNSEAAVSFIQQLASSSYSTFGEMSNFAELESKDYLKTVVETRFNVTLSTITNSDTRLFDSDTITMTMTEMGLCYSYNSVISSYNNPNYWMANRWSYSSNYKVFAASPLDGDIFSQITGMNSGVMVYYHSPFEVADSVSRGSPCLNSTYKTLDISAQSIYSTQELRSLSVKQRKCKFLEESDLSISPVYSYNLCRMECRLRLSNKLCGCIPYFYRPTSKYRVCNVEGMDFLSKYSDLLKTLRYSDKRKVECSCYPPCDDVNYKVEGEDTVNEWLLGTSVKWGLIKYPRLRFKRDVIFGISEVLVAMGGTAGLFFGCSVLSLVEIVYFFTLRLFWIVINQKPFEQLKFT